MQGSLWKRNCIQTTERMTESNSVGYTLKQVYSDRSAKQTRQVCNLKLLCNSFLPLLRALSAISLFQFGVKTIRENLRPSTTGNRSRESDRVWKKHTTKPQKQLKEIRKAYQINPVDPKLIWFYQMSLKCQSAHDLLKLTFRELALHKRNWRGAGTRKVSFIDFILWPIYIINLVVK